MAEGRPWRAPTKWVVAKSAGPPLPALLQRLEVLLHLRLVVPGDLLPRHRFFHHLPVLAADAHVLKTGRHVGALAEEIGVVAFLPARARLAFDPGVEGISAQALGGVPLGGGIPPLARQEPLPLAEVGVPGAPAPPPA